MRNRHSGPQGAVVTCRGVSMVYRSLLGRRSVRALAGFDLDVGRGEIVGILGPNGSGKTTLFKILLGLVRPTAGRARLFGGPPGDPNGKARLGFMPEENCFHPFLTVEGTLRLHGRLAGLGRPEIRRCGAGLVRSLGLEEARGPLARLSKGTVRKVALAQALLGDPELLLLDEPLSGIDPVASVRVKEEILARGKKGGGTVILASHLLAEVEEICDRIVVLAAGRTLCSGPTRELLARDDELEILVRGLPPQARPRIVEGIEAEGGEVLSAGPRRRRLTSFFLEWMQR